ncbi:hypothetical protein CKM354_000912800 [Cercospora kikuchii]|uniref:Uncharacterized protein n=1 Tax=Cercospora kikuchii TaxID=84275 RepID=A0A9P3CK82_9PEZI|nr:uncharacterized protein CKM354_000912800 [Cercospora kikuchii]GIZ45984.1 hypothetical protein CKM354_000912800 [Cercospora kikuchii]
MLSKKQFKSLQARIATLPNELSDIILEKLLEFDHPTELELADFKPPLAFFLSPRTRSKYASRFFATTKILVRPSDLKNWTLYGLTDWHRKAIKHVGILWLGETRTTWLKLATAVSGARAGEVMTQRLHGFVEELAAEPTNETTEMIQAGGSKENDFDAILIKWGENYDFEVSMKWSFGFIDVTGDGKLKWTEEVEVKKIRI